MSVTLTSQTKSCNGIMWNHHGLLLIYCCTGLLTEAIANSADDSIAAWSDNRNKSKSYTDPKCFVASDSSSDGKQSVILATQYPNVVAPDSLKAPLKTEYNLLISGGTSNPYQRSFEALKLPILPDESTNPIFTEIKDGLRYVFQTENRWTLALHGTGTTGMSAVLDNLIEPGDTAVVGVIGHWGTQAAKIVEKLGGRVYRLKKPPGSSISLKEIDVSLILRRPKVLFLVNGESSTGVYQSIDGVGALCQKYGCISVVDAVATVGQLPIKMDERKIDVVYTNSQKGLGGIVGLAPCSFSPRAIKAIKGRRFPTRIFPTDILLQGKAWNVETQGNPHTDWVHSVSMPLMYMLREGLAKIADEGIENIWNRHQRVYNYFIGKATKLGLELFVEKPSERLATITTFKPPQEKNSYKIAYYVYDKFRIDIAPGMGPTYGKVIRIGLFGQNVNETTVDKLLSALESAISSPDTNS